MLAKTEQEWTGAYKKMTTEYIHTVQYYETDRMGVTHHSNYIRWMEEARIDFLEKIGWGYDRLEELGIISPVVSVQGDYRNTTTFRDRIVITVTAKEFKGVRLIVGYEMKKYPEGITVFTGTSSHCFQDRDGRLIRLHRVLPEFDKRLREIAGNVL